ncbi:MAG: ABC transporter permease [Melioribacteraceae bacterium]|nr:ABC transporter permease [Melioribacteraceae bacterium]MCF8265810.1 ABC transporter permease [Melioribacteraceae bacterium]MCF8413939.1 ABC transporter permease [Melioribacteraceae bacterium]MCF8430529.1 ABC transporter permease [Melioribacteraceae bacterium]
MKSKNLFKVAFKSLLKARMRSLLTTLGIIIGVSAVIIMVAVGEGAQREIEEQINSLGSNLIVIFPGASRSGGVSRGAGSFNRFTMKDLEKIEEQATLIKAVSPVVRSGGQVIGGGTNWNTGIYGVSPSYLEIRDWELEYGEIFTERDERSRSKVCVLGSEVAENLFPNQNPVGEMIRIVNTPFKVIGVLKEKGQSAMGSSNDDLILAPSNTVLYRLSGGRYIHFIYASASSLEKIDAAQEELRQIMRAAHNIDFGEDDDFTIRNQTEITEAASESSEVMTMLLGSVAAVSLIVGGIGIMNIMLVSVTERTREIGIRLSIGARGSDILIQFLLEAIVLSLIGGILGILISIFTIYLLNEYSTLTAELNLFVVAFALIFSGFVGVFFGFYPARKASALNPIDALRYE